MQQAFFFSPLQHTQAGNTKDGDSYPYSLIFLLRLYKTHLFFCSLIKKLARFFAYSLRNSLIFCII